MKKTLLFVFLLFSFLKMNSQCEENVGGFGNNVTDPPSYNISGDVSILLNTNNTITLNLASNFKTAPGPDVRAFLVVSDGKSDSELTKILMKDLNHIEIGLTQPTGAQSLTVAIPKGKDITKFDKVFFYCLQFNHFWDLGTFTSFSQNNCAVLAVENNQIENVKIYPNPTKIIFDSRILILVLVKFVFLMFWENKFFNKKKI